MDAEAFVLKEDIAETQDLINFFLLSFYQMRDLKNG